MEKLGDLLRQLRKQRGLTQERLAETAHITARTLRSWEANQQHPRELELERVLKVLDVTPQEKRPILEGLRETRSVRLIHQVGFLPDFPPAMLGALPGIGDLLRSLRLRRGWTQEQLARVLRVNRATVLRWEATQNLPSDEDIKRLCLLLDASPEETEALRAKHLLVSFFPPQPTLEECAKLCDMLLAIRGGNFTLLPLLDLYALTLKRHLRFLLGQSTGALELLVDIEVLHGWWLQMHGRKAEAHTLNLRVLNLTRGPLKPQMASIRALNILSGHAAQRAKNAEDGIKFLSPWLPLLPPTFHSWLLCDMAFYASNAQQPDTAFTFLREAERAIQHNVTDQKMKMAHFRLTKARVLLNTGNPLAAMDWLPPLSLGDGRIHELMIWAETYLAAGDRVTAERYLCESKTLLDHAPLPARQKKMEQLSRQLN